MNLKKRQLMVLVIVAYGPSLFYPVLLVLLAMESGQYPYYFEMFMIYAIGAMITFTLSTLLIKKYRASDTPFDKTLWKIAFAHFPIVLSLFVITILYPFS